MPMMKLNLYWCHRASMMFSAAGFDPDRLYLVEGEPGTGKTTLALQFLLEGTRSGERGLYVTLSESEKELRLVATRHGWSLWANCRYSSLFPPRLVARSRAGVRTLFHPAEMELSETSKLIFDRVNVARAGPESWLTASRKCGSLAQNPLRYRRLILRLEAFLRGAQ